MSRKRPCPIGQRFGRLVVLGEAEPSTYQREDGTGGKTPRWHARCDCGKEISLSAAAFRRNEAASCGCARRKPQPQVPTVVGARYGRFVVLGDGPRNRYMQRTWHCRCDCGVEKVMVVSSLTRGRAHSCGCLIREMRKGIVPSAMTDAAMRARTRTPEELPLCPVCGTKQKRQYEVVFCPRRCDGVLAVRPRRRAA